MQLLENRVMANVTFFIYIHLRICCRIKGILKTKNVFRKLQHNYCKKQSIAKHEL